MISIGKLVSYEQEAGRYIVEASILRDVMRIGYLVYSYGTTSDGVKMPDDTVYLETIEIFHPHRGHGLGIAAVGVLSKQLKHAGYRYVVLSPRSTVENWWRRLGFDTFDSYHIFGGEYVLRREV